MAVAGGAVRADKHFLGDLLALPTRIIRVVLLAFARLVAANERVGLATMRVLLGTVSHDKVLGGSTGRDDGPTQLTAEHENEP
jgi:hypothetical protein